jgi:hypothetical protein
MGVLGMARGIRGHAMPARNVQRGLFRFWAVAAVLWIAGQAANIANLVLDKDFRPEDGPQVAAFGAVFALGPPLLLLLVGAAVFWIAGGFVRRPGDGGDLPFDLKAAAGARWTWATSETEALYRHLVSDWHFIAEGLAREHALRRSADGHETWDRSRTAFRRFGRALRAAVEDRFDAFYADGVTADGAAAVCRDVGSLWRVHWDELAERLLTEFGNVGGAAFGDGKMRPATPVGRPAAIVAAEAAANG